MDLRLHLFVLGALINATAAAMLIPFLFDLFMGSQDWWVFLLSAGITAFAGTLIMLASTERVPTLNLRQALLLTVFIWIAIGSVGTIPFFIAPLNLSIASSFFESMSGITTTGSTTLVGLDQIQPGILLWRAMLQWLGGVGIVVMALSVLPALQVGGMQLFRTEAFDQSEKMLPRAGEIAAAVMAVYGLITFGGFIILWIAGMSPFDAVAHSMTSIATGGFSTHDASIGYFSSVKIEAAVVFLMILGSLPFLIFFRLKSGDFLVLIQDSQVRIFFALLIGAVAMT
ncbi:MAG: potassium transporter TrkG, partial [Alphaproteobacteria bacterium]